MEIKMSDKITLDLFTQYRFLSGADLSPDGKNVAFYVKESDVEQNRYKTNIWLYNVAQKRRFQLTGLNDAGSFLWLDNNRILFMAIRDEQDKKQKKQTSLSVFYEIDIRGGEARRAFAIDRQVRQIKALDDDRFLIAAFDDLNAPDTTNLDEEAKGKALKAYQDDQKIHDSYEEIPFRGNGVGRIDGCRTRLYLFNRSDQSCKRLTEDYFALESFELNGSKTEGALLGASYQGKAPITNKLYHLDLKTEVLRPLNEELDVAHGMALFINDQEIVVAATDGKKFGINENSLFYRVDIKSGKRVCITPDLDISLWSSVGSDCRLGGGSAFQVDHEKIYFVSTQGYNSHICSVDRNGVIDQITNQTGSIDSFVVKDGAVYYVAMRGLDLQELYTLDGSEEVVLTDFNEMIKDYKRADYEYLGLKRSNVGGPERTVDGWVLKPVGYQPGNKYPAILDIHGGPKTVYGEVFYHEMQLWANMGYFVFFSNPVGGDGKGNQFADIRGEFGKIDYDDLMAFTDAVLEKYSDIDPEKLGVTGGSYGGFMTNWIIGQTERFKAAASQRSIASWSSMFGTTDIGYYFAEDQMDAGIWNNFDKMWAQSPIKYANRAKTPTLFIHSEEDYRCWIVEGIQMFTALKFFNIPAKLCVLKGENHDLSRSGRPKQRMKRLEEMTNWFEKYLK